MPIPVKRLNHAVLFVRENVDVMISTADGAELFGRDRFQIADRF